jgi:hypothetical protein
MSRIPLDLHAAASSIALLAAPKFTVDERQIDFQPGWHPGEKGNQSLAVRLSGSEVAQHKRSIVPDA